MAIDFAAPSASIFGNYKDTNPGSLSRRIPYNAIKT
jgi:hypothetical protein